MAVIEWAMWANEQAIVSAVLIFIGGIIGVVRTPHFIFSFWQCAAAAIPISVLVFLIEYPRGKRKKGRTIERKFQVGMEKVLEAFKPVSSNYFVRFVLYLLFSVPCCFLLPTLMGAISLQIAALIYLLAAVKGEEWSAVNVTRKPASDSAVTSAPPSRPPPRAPRRDAKNGDPEAPTDAEGTPNRY